MMLHEYHNPALPPSLACRYVGVENAIIHFIRQGNAGLSQHVAEVVKFCPELHTDLAGQQSQQTNKNLPNPTETGTHLEKLQAF